MRVIIFYTYMYFFFKELFAYVELGAAGEQSKQPYRGQLCHRALPHVWLQDGALHGCGGGLAAPSLPTDQTPGRHQAASRHRESSLGCFPPGSTAGEQHSQEGVWTGLKGLQQADLQGKGEDETVALSSAALPWAQRLISLLPRSCQTRVSKPGGETDQP